MNAPQPPRHTVTIVADRASTDLTVNDEHLDVDYGVLVTFWCFDDQPWRIDITQAAKRIGPYAAVITRDHNSDLEDATVITWPTRIDWDGHTLTATAQEQP